MTGQDRAQRIWRYAAETLEELQQARSRCSWNRCIRKAQEVVELSIKALLIGVGVDYPKQHDVGKVFERVARERGLPLSPEDTEDIVNSSAALARARGPAFYFERDFSEKEALDAIERAGRVHRRLALLLEQVCHKNAPFEPGSSACCEGKKEGQ